MADELEFSILEDGRAKVVSDAISMPNHVTAENIFRYVSQLTGVKETRKARTDVKHGDSKHHHHVKS